MNLTLLRPSAEGSNQPTSSTEATISPLNSSRFGQADPFMTDKVEIWRMSATSYDEGEPRMERQKVATVRCRLDDLRSRHTDAVFRSPVNAVQQNYGLCFMSPDIDVRVNDVLRDTRVSPGNKDVTIVEINLVMGAFGPHHLEIFTDKVDGSA